MHGAGLGFTAPMPAFFSNNPARCLLFRAGRFFSHRTRVILLHARRLFSSRRSPAGFSPHSAPVRCRGWGGKVVNRPGSCFFGVDPVEEPSRAEPEIGVGGYLAGCMGFLVGGIVGVASVGRVVEYHRAWVPRAPWIAVALLMLGMFLPAIAGLLGGLYFGIKRGEPGV